MKTLRLLAMFVAMIVASAAPASADLLNFLVTLDGSQEVPANASPATGSATVLLDTTANTVTVSLSFSGLVAAQTNAHIHSPAAPGVNAPPTVPLPLG